VDRVLPPLARSCRRVLPRKRICSPDVAIQLSAADRPYGNGQRPCRSAALTAARRGLSGRQGLSASEGDPSDAEGVHPFGDASLERKKANASFGCIRSCPSGEAAAALFPRRVLAFLSEQPRTIGGELSVGLLTDVFRRVLPRQRIPAAFPAKPLQPPVTCFRRKRICSTITAIESPLCRRFHGRVTDETCPGFSPDSLVQKQGCVSSS